MPNSYHGGRGDHGDSHGLSGFCRIIDESGKRNPACLRDSVFDLESDGSSQNSKGNVLPSVCSVISVVRRRR
jgi:hypothetical protein